ncbi:unnamed protein product [Parnassius apollo]|uniref:(apollo) hypothetical protein n=1 Tax=Parnassius apollo TaxID=110799 RepID=A0A8S3Y9L5_PARAO|nr:unnamed protein product [Parnassius apollo]
MILNSPQKSVSKETARFEKKVNFVVDVVGVKLESESNTDDEIETHETSEKQTEENHTEIFESIKLQLNKDLNDLLTGGANVCDKRKLSTESDTENKKKPRLADEDTSPQLTSKCKEDSQTSLQLIPEPQSTLQQNACTSSVCTISTQTENIERLKKVNVDNLILSVNSFNASVTNRLDSLRKKQMNVESSYQYQQKHKEQRLVNSTDNINSEPTINPEDKDTMKEDNHSSSYSADEQPSLSSDIPQKEQLNAESCPPNQKDQKCISQKPNVLQPASRLRKVSRIANARKPRRLRKRPKKRKKEPEKNKISEASGYALIRKNSLNLITNSTICVFQWNKSWYRCFICQEAYPELNALRQHSEEHTLQEIEEKIIAQQNRMVKVDVSQIICKLCKKQLQDLPDLRKHLTEAHKIRFEIEDDLLVPFKIDAQSLQCQLCSKPFDSFRLLNMHMNKHYQNHVCHICGATFSTLVFLNLHKTRSHRSWLCKECDVVFVSKADKKRHDVSVHKVKFERKLRFPCQHCGERFFQENYRAQHLVEKHGMQKPEYKCEFCGKVFITRSLCNNHVKNVHQKKKNHQCDICRQLFYTRSDVARHRVTHTKEKNFSCESCNSLFATKDSLRRHMKRTH